MRNRMGRVLTVLVLAAVMLGLGAAFTRGGPGQSAPPANRGGGPTVDASVASADLGSAIATLQDRLRRVPKDHPGWASLGTAYVQQAAITGEPGYYPKAAGALGRSLEIQPRRNAAALTGLAALAAARHDFSLAVKHARAAQRINPYSAANQGVLSDALEQRGRYADARVEIQRMLDLRPGVPSFTRASYAREQVGELASAADALDEALELASRPSDQAYCLFYLGELAWNSGNLVAADRYYARGLRLDPSYTQLLAGRAKVAAAQGRTKAALEIYQDVVRRLPVPTYLIAYADLLRALGRVEEATVQEAVVSATETLFNKQGVITGLELALFHADRGNEAEALVAAREAWREQRSVEAADAYAWALETAGKSEEALEYARLAARLGTKSALFAFHRGMIEESLGHPDRAREFLQRSLDINPHFSPLLAPRARAGVQALAER